MPCLLQTLEQLIEAGAIPHYTNEETDAGGQTAIKYPLLLICQTRNQVYRMCAMGDPKT